MGLPHPRSSANLYGSYFGYEWKLVYKLRDEREKFQKILIHSYQTVKTNKSNTSKNMHIERLKPNIKQWAEGTEKELQIHFMTEHQAEHMCNIPVATWLQGFCQLNWDSDLELTLSIPWGSIQLRRTVSRLGQVGIMAIQQQRGWATTRNLTWLASRWWVTILLLLSVSNS